MGFAVVADEVRNLAQRAAQSAKETAAKIENAVTKTAHGVQISEKVATSLAEIVDKVRQVDTLAAEVAAASKEQNQGIEQVNTAVGQMDKITQSNAANAEESASAAEELNAQAAALQEAVVELLHLVGGQPTDTGRRNPPHHIGTQSPAKANGGHGKAQGVAATSKRKSSTAPAEVVRFGGGEPGTGDFKEF